MTSTLHMSYYLGNESPREMIYGGSRLRPDMFSLSVLRFFPYVEGSTLVSQPFHELRIMGISSILMLNVACSCNLFPCLQSAVDITRLIFP